MKKITLTFLLYFTTLSFFAQTYSTGVVNLDTNYTVQFDVNTANNTVTMTMVGPDNIWLGVAPGVSTGLGMGNLGDDVIIFNSNGLEDRNMPSGTGTPNLDGSQDWNITSNTTNSGTRTIIATRAIDTGDSNDYVFPSSATSLPILWARGSNSLNLGYHGANKGGEVANLTLGADDFIVNNFKIYPNPTSTLINIQTTKAFQDTKYGVYNTLGKQVLAGNISNLNSTINISNLNSGVYLVNFKQNNTTETHKIIKL